MNSLGKVDAKPWGATYRLPENDLRRLVKHYDHRTLPSQTTFNEKILHGTIRPPEDQTKQMVLARGENDRFCDSYFPIWSDPILFFSI